MHKVLVSIYINDLTKKLPYEKTRKMHYASLLHMYHVVIIAIYALIRHWRKKLNDGFAMAKRQANYVTHVMTGQCIIIKSSISRQECVLLHDRPAIGHYADSIMPVLLPVTREEKRVTDDAR